MKKITALLLALIMLASLCACSFREEVKTDDDIVILFTNDIHGGITDGVTLSGVSYYKKQMLLKTPFVALVDCGDAIQGSNLTTVSKGEAAIRAMNTAEYDICTFGNHEFDYGIPRLFELIAMADAQYVNCNITYSGSGENYFENVKPYVIKDFGKTKVAFVGIDTPHTVSDASPLTFMENGEFVYDFAGGEDGSRLYSTVQATVDAAKNEGADYVIALSHLGNAEEESPFRSDDLIANTNGIDVVLDGHSHTVFDNFFVKNKDGENVICAQTGTKLENLGQITITSTGIITATLISDITDKDDTASEKIDEITATYGASLDEVVANTVSALSISDGDGIRAVRNRETAIGNLVSDSLRYKTNADISYANGGGIRAGIPKGEVKYSDIIDVTPFGNHVCVIEVTGAEILDMLEYFVKDAKSEVVDTAENKPVGESGSFPNMSGITFTVSTKVASSVVTDEEDMLISVGETKRVSDVKIEINGVYEPVDLTKTYTFATNDYMAFKGGSGMLHYLADHNVVSTFEETDYEVLREYIVEGLKGDLSAYSEPAGRITFKR